MGIRIIIIQPIQTSILLTLGSIEALIKGRETQQSHISVADLTHPSSN